MKKNTLDKEILIKNTFVNFEIFFKDKVNENIRGFLYKWEEYFVIFTQDLLDKMDDEYFYEGIEKHLGEYVYIDYIVGQENGEGCALHIQKDLENLVKTLMAEFDFSMDAPDEFLHYIPMLTILQELNSNKKGE